MEIEEFKALARELFLLNSLNDWKLLFSNTKKVVGLCDYRDKSITISKLYVEVNSVETMRDILLHEIAHTLVGIEAGHGPTWKLKAREIGCINAVKACGSFNSPKGKYIGICPHCKEQFNFFRKPRGKKVCLLCLRKYTDKTKPLAIDLYA